MRSSQARSASPTRGVIRRRKARAPQPYFGCSTRVAWLATWCVIRLPPEGHRLATTASLGAKRRTENGRSRADRPNVAPPYCGGPAAGAGYRSEKPPNRKPLARLRVATDFRVTLIGKGLKRHPGTAG